MKTHVYVVLACVPYEGCSVAGIFQSQASADAYVTKHTKARERFERLLAKEGGELPKFPKHAGEDLAAYKMEVKP